MALQPTHIVDTSALIAYFKGEQGHEVFAELLRDEANVLAMHAVNLCEVYYSYYRSDGFDRAEDAWAKAVSIVAVVSDMSEHFVKRIGRWKVDHALGLGDATVAATAEEYGCPLVTADHDDFDEIDQAGAADCVVAAGGSAFALRSALKLCFVLRRCRGCVPFSRFFGSAVSRDKKRSSFLAHLSVAHRVILTLEAVIRRSAFSADHLVRALTPLVNVSGRANELFDAMVRSFNATTGAEIGPYRKSRLR